MRSFVRAGVAGLVALALACGQGRNDPSTVQEARAPVSPAASAHARAVASLGAATSAVLTATEGVQYQAHENGVLVSSDDWGPVVISTPVFQKWQSLAGGVAPDGGDLLAYVGAPTRDSTAASEVLVGTFERGMVVARPSAGTAFLVTGPIYQRYYDLPALGWPIGDEAPAANGGRTQGFERGRILWSAATGAHGFGSAVQERWEQLGGAAGTLGYPISDERPILRDGVEIGRVARFAGGNVYTSVRTGAWEVSGTFRAAYETQYGGAASWLGLPIGAAGTTAAGTEYQEFEGGMLVRSPTNGLWAFAGLDLYWGHAQGNGEDCHGFCGSQDLYVKARVETPDGTRSARFPGRGSWGSSGDINQSWPLTGTARHDFIVIVEATGWDQDDFSSDDKLGHVRVQYDVDNLFGILDAGIHYDAHFGIEFGVRNPIPFDATNWVASFGWRFPNPTTEKLSYDQYAATFADVDPDEKWWRHPFNAAFYELIYKGLASDGNCYGMSLSSMAAEKGALSWAEPIYRFPMNDQILDAVNLKHGYQVGAEAIDWIAGLFLAGETHDPVGVFNRTEAAFTRGDAPLLSLTKYFGAKGHAIRPYRWDRSGDPWRMYVWDNNSPGDDKQFVAVTPGANTFTFEGSGGYAGGVWTGDRLVETPYHVVENTPRTPFWEIFSLLGGGTIIVVSDAGQTVQLADAEGRTLYDPSLTTAPTRWEQLRRDAGRIPDVARIPLASGDDAAPAPELYYGKGKGRTYVAKLTRAPEAAEGTPAQWMVSSATLSAIFDIPATSGTPDIVTARELGTPRKAVAIGLPPDAHEKTVRWTVAGADKARWTQVANVKLAPGQTIVTRVSNAGNDVRFENDGPATSGELTVQNGVYDMPVPLGTITIPGGGATAVSSAAPFTTFSVAGVAGRDGWFRSPVTVTLTPVDLTKAGIDRTEYRVEHGRAHWHGHGREHWGAYGCEACGARDGARDGDHEGEHEGEHEHERDRWHWYTAPITYDVEGASTLSCRSKDRAGVVENAQAHALKIDTRPPWAWVQPLPPIATRPAPLPIRFAAWDPHPGSGVASLAGELDGTVVKDGDSIDTLWLAPGDHTLKLTVTDLAGWSSAQTATFELRVTFARLHDTIEALRHHGEITSRHAARALAASLRSPWTRHERKTASSCLDALAAEVTRQRAAGTLTERGAALLLGDIQALGARVRSGGVEWGWDD